MTAPNTRRARLASRLRAIRTAAFPTGSQLADRVGWPQPRVSKLETGAQIPTEDDIRAWVVATSADSEVEGELLELLDRARREYATHRDSSRQGGRFANMQAQVAALEAQATRLAEWQPAMIPGLLQTAEYARALFGLSFTVNDEDEIEAAVDGRVKRQEILYQRGRRVQFVIGEAALRSAPDGAVDTLRGQLDRLLTVAGLSTVELGVLPFPAMPIMPLSSFALRDDVAVMETNSGEQQLFEPDEVAVYVQAFDRLRDASATGPDAVTLIQRAAADLR